MSKPHDNFVAEYNIKGLTIRCYSKNESSLLAVRELSSMKNNVFDGTAFQSPIYDISLGPKEPGEICETCGLQYLECTGHYGALKLALPVYNPCFFPDLIKLLKRSCLSCHNLMASECERLVFTYQLYVIRHDRIDLVSLFDSIDWETFDQSSVYLKNRFDDLLYRYEFTQKFASLAKSTVRTMSRNSICALRSAIRSFEQKLSKVRKCPQCDVKPRQIRHDQNFKIFHAQVSSKSKNHKSTIGSIDEDVDLLTSTPKRNTLTNANKQTYFTPLDIKNHLEKLWNNEKRLLSVLFNLNTNDKKDSSIIDIFLIESLIVTPPKFRPLLFVNNRSVDSYESMLLKHIIHDNNDLKSTLIKCKQQVTDNANSNLQKFWISLQKRTNCICEGQSTFKQNNDNNKGLKDLIDKKDGLLRQNLMGKRVDFAGRSVISPDPLLATFEIGIPEVFAVNLDYPEVLTKFNFHRLQKLILNGPDVYPGARYVKDGNGCVIRLRDLAQRRRVAKSLKPNSNVTIYRHLMNGDYLMVNRQPTLHRPSFMGHQVRVLKGEKVLRLHYSNCKSYNADFDGDELNFHFPQDERSRVEISQLMLNAQHYIVCKDGSPLGGLIHDHIDAAVKLTCRDTFFNAAGYFELLVHALSNHKSKLIKILPPCILKPKKLWSGKQVISSILASICGEFDVNIEQPCKIPDKEWYSSIYRTNDKYLSESLVLFRRGQLLRGVLDKNHIGSASYGFIHCCQELYGGMFANSVLSVLSRMLTFNLHRNGFTLGTEDVTKKNIVNDDVATILNSCSNKSGKLAIKQCFNLDTEDEKILSALYRQAHLNPYDSQALLCQLDATYKGVTDKTTTLITERVFSSRGMLKSFPKNNLQLMVSSGAKGSKVNIMQMTCLLGQQELEGRRPFIQMSGSSLPCFRPYETCPSACGFIYSSFASGLKPHEYFFHCMAGREGLVDTAVKTSRSGYLQRCLVKHMEGLIVEYDMSVRDSDGSLIQFIYGEDGIATDKAAFLQGDRCNFFIENSRSVYSRVPYYLSCMERLKSKERFKLLNQIHKQLLNETSTYRISPFLKMQCMLESEIEQMSLSSKKQYLYDKWKEMSDAQIEELSDPKIPEPIISNIIVGTCMEAISEKCFDNIYNITKHKRKHKEMRDLLMFRALRSLVSPGEAVGLVAAQSIGEPSTQMTLNTFHFAGRGEMNVTLGIPRLRELLMSASEKQSTMNAWVPVKRKRVSKARRLTNKYTNKTFKEIVQHISIDESFESHTWIYKIHAQLNQPCSQFQDPILSFEKRLIPAFIKKVARVQKDAESTTLTKTVVSRAKEKPKDADDKIDQMMDEENAIVEETPQPEEEDTLMSDKEDEEMEYESEESEIIDLNEDVNMENNGVELIELTRKRKISETENVRLCKSRVADVLKLSPLITEYSYSQTDETWVDFTLKMSASNPRIDIVGILDEMVNSVTIREMGNIKRAIVVDSKDADGNASYIFKTEGIDFEELMKYPSFFELNKISCNSIHEICKMFGIEAAKSALILEIKSVFDAYGIKVDNRHLTLLADYLTHEGRYCGFNRHYMVNNPSSVQRMSFETAFSIIKESALKCEMDSLQSPSSRTLMGRPAKLGTGFFDIFSV